MKLFKSPWTYVLGFIIILGIYLSSKVADRINPGPRIEDSSTSIIGFNHIGIVVHDLDTMLKFYQNATGFPLVDRFQISDNDLADKLFDQNNIAFETAILKGPNMLLELTEFASINDSLISKMPPQGPGMTHTCYQSAQSNSGYDRFKKAGVEMLSRGIEPIDLGGYGVTYAYAYDPEGNIVELEQMSDLVTRLSVGKKWASENPLWMTQVALLSPDLPRLTAFYEKILDIEPFRVGSYKDNPKLDEIVDLDNMVLDAAWFGMDSQGKKLELMQYINPKTPAFKSAKKLTDLGYTYSFEVLDIYSEYERLKSLNVRTVSEPVLLNAYWRFFAFDIDGNIFSMRQAKDESAPFSVRN